MLGQSAGHWAKYMKPYILRLRFNKSDGLAHVTHRVTGRLVAGVNTTETDLRSDMVNLQDVQKGMKMGQILAERLKLKEVNQVSLELEDELKKNKQKFEPLIRATIYSLTKNGIQFV
ncbi:hypothetical protein O6H91_05G088600 [Diphasiastrum complanatum]|nr:hypothetical protein O6H91_05G088600 [Diphasiastrum complanatum]